MGERAEGGRAGLLDGDDLGAAGDEGGGEDAGARADLEDLVRGGHGGGLQGRVDDGLVDLLAMSSRRVRVKERRRCSDRPTENARGWMRRTASEDRCPAGRAGRGPGRRLARYRLQANAAL